jgi:acetyl-CoA acetyltransferase
MAERTLRGVAAPIGIADVQLGRRPEGRTGLGIAAQAAIEAIKDAGLEKSDIDGLITEIDAGASAVLVEYLQLFPTWSSGVNMFGASGATSIAMAAAAINAGLATNVLCVVGSSTPEEMARGSFSQTPYAGNFEAPYGPVIAQNGNYALIAKRHEYEYGTTPEQRAKVAVDQRANAQGNPQAVFYGTELSTDDVLNSRMVADPLHLLECVMPTSGASAVVVTAAERATAAPHSPVYLLGAGVHIDHDIMPTHVPRLTRSPVAISAKNAFEHAGLSPRDMDIVSVYDCYTITVIVTLEDAGFAPKGEGGPFVQDHDLTFKGDFPVNTHGGQLSFGQSNLAGGFSHVTEGIRQMMGRGGARQATKELDYCFVNG